MLPSLWTFIQLIIINSFSVRIVDSVDQSVLNMKLLIPPRLQSIVNLIPKDRVVADIGADHGILSAALVGHAKRVIAVEASNLAASKGVAHLASKLGYRKDQLSVHIGSGLYPIIKSNIRNVDTIVMAGMGTTSILQILSQDVSAVLTSDCAAGSPLSSSGSNLDLSATKQLGISQIVFQPSPPSLTLTLKLARILYHHGWYCNGTNICRSSNGRFFPNFSFALTLNKEVCWNGYTPLHDVFSTFPFIKAVSSDRDVWRDYLRIQKGVLDASVVGLGAGYMRCDMGYDNSRMKKSVFPTESKNTQLNFRIEATQKLSNAIQSFIVENK